MNRAAPLILIVLLVLTTLALVSGCDDTIEPGASDPYFEPWEPGRYELELEPLLQGPERVDFGVLQRGERGVEVIELLNAGRAPLEVLGWEVNNERFSLSSPRSSGGQRPSALEPGERVVVQLEYVAEEPRPERGVLRVITSHHDLEIALTANVEEACLMFSSRSIDFGVVALGESARGELLVSNCSRVTPTTFSLASVTPERGTFSVEGLEPGREVRLEPGEAHTLQLSFTPPRLGEHAGRLELRSEVDGGRLEGVDLYGGATSDCPLARISGVSSQGDEVSAAPRGLHEGEPLETLELLAESDGPISRVQWALVSRPADSGAALFGASSEERNGLFLDLTGEYAVELHIWDERDVRSCEPAVLAIEAIPREDMHIQLVWNTPNDPQQFDAMGSDVDLHLLHEGGIWDQGPWDCYWQQESPDWGELGDPSDDPSLDIDDTDGWGPENINLDNPVEGTRYHIGVHYFSDQGYGPSYATVRLYLRSQLVAESSPQRLENGEFWHAFEVHWPSQTVVEYGDLYATFPSGTFSPD